MLGTRTKQINVYGKRSQRVVAVSDERPSRKDIPNIFDDSEAPIHRAPIVSRMRKREDVSKPEGSTSSTSPSPRVVHVRRRKPLVSPIRRRRSSSASGEDDSEVEAVDQKPEAVRKDSVPAKGARPSKATRAPLTPRALNVPSSPAMARKHKHVSSDMYRKLYKPSPSTVNVDIIVLDEDGNTVGTERRISRVRCKSKHNAAPSTRNEGPPKDILPDSEDELVTRPRRLQKATSRRRVYSDSSEDDVPSSSNPPNDTLPDEPKDRLEITRPVQPRPSGLPQISRSKATEAEASKPIAHSRSEPSTRFVPSQQRIQPQPPSLPYKTRIPSPIARPRQLTPIRGLRNSRNAIAPPSPPTPSDFDSSIELSDNDFESSPFPNTSPYLIDPSEDHGLHDFSSFIKASRTTVAGGDYGFKKIGEASYSEVFGIGGVVLKIIPLRNESRSHGVIDGKQHQSSDVEGPATSEAKDVRKEIIVTRAMGEVCNGFVKLLKTYVVRGRYPELLLRLWDEYNEEKGSESIRPDSFTLAQVYAIVVLPNGGPDLEAYTFTNPRKSGWRQACSVFWQVTKALAYAEQFVSFEHRDLHWGQILVKDLPLSAALQNLDLNSRAEADNLFMDDAAHWSLSRMDATDANGFEKVYWTPIEEEVFMGEGDYQFDIYRIMRDHVGSRWERFNPLTNVMWLHYIALKLLHSKDLKPPGVTGSLSELEKLLAKCVSEVRARKKAVKKKIGKGRGGVGFFSCAADVVRYGVSKGWIMPTA
ncbi:hypothetical protein F5887DRAFT_1269216 [Amanita rubescens]|nr:hypothetical protein F5887DRAFT_1269216 [Amanita rubescens]